MENKSKTEKINFPNLNKCTIAIIGLGYVGLPLAVEFAKKRNCIISGDLLERKIIGFDINEKRLQELKQGNDSTSEINTELLSDGNFINFTSDISTIASADVFIVAVPTPINNFNEPDLSALKGASKTVGQALKIKKIEKVIIYQSLFLRVLFFLALQRKFVSQ